MLGGRFPLLCAINTSFGSHRQVAQTSNEQDQRCPRLKFQLTAFQTAHSISIGNQLRIGAPLSPSSVPLTPSGSGFTRLVFTQPANISRVTLVHFSPYLAEPIKYLSAELRAPLSLSGIVNAARTSLIEQIYRVCHGCLAEAVAQRIVRATAMTSRSAFTGTTIESRIDVVVIREPEQAQRIRNLLLHKTQSGFSLAGDRAHYLQQINLNDATPFAATALHWLQLLSTLPRSTNGSAKYCKVLACEIGQISDTPEEDPMNLAA